MSEEEKKEIEEESEGEEEVILEGVEPDEEGEGADEGDEEEEGEETEEEKEIYEAVSKQGFMELDEWVSKGKREEDWKDPKTFLDDGRARNSVAQKEIVALRRDITALKKSSERQEKAHKQSVEIAKAAYRDKLKAQEAELMRLKDEEYTALEEGDRQTATDKFKEQEALRKEEITPPEEYVEPETDEPQADAQGKFQEWLGDNRWFAENKAAHAAAIEASNRLGMLHEDGPELWELVKAEVESQGLIGGNGEKKVPANPQPRTMKPTGARGKKGTQKKGFDAMPEDSKKEYYATFKEDLTKDEYAASHWKIEGEAQ